GFLERKFSNAIELPEQALLQYVLSKDYVSNMDRCFGSAHSDPISDDFKKFLKQIFVKEEGRLQQLAIAEDRYYFKWVFPNCSLTTPTSLHDLVRNVVESMSSNLLNYSTVAGDFPKDAVFQHLFLDGLARFTKADCSICLELLKIFRDPNSGGSGSVPGEIDFYLNRQLCWGIELLINGVGI
ncbi:hypothetical protein HDU78_000485, partial [Chytriomyces hyalinus]